MAESKTLEKLDKTGKGIVSGVKGFFSNVEEKGRVLKKKYERYEEGRREKTRLNTLKYKRRLKEDIEMAKDANENMRLRKQLARERDRYRPRFDTLEDTFAPKKRKRRRRRKGEDDRDKYRRKPTTLERAFNPKKKRSGSGDDYLSGFNPGML